MRGGYGVDIAYAATGFGLMALGSLRAAGPHGRRRALRRPRAPRRERRRLHRVGRGADRGRRGLALFAWASERAFACTVGARSLRAPLVLVESARWPSAWWAW
ncbi:MAG: hypothetical protein R3A52_30065 [Polyangiales bacterium]